MISLKSFKSDSFILFSKYFESLYGLHYLKNIEIGNKLGCSYYLYIFMLYIKYII